MNKFILTTAVFFVFLQNQAQAQTNTAPMVPHMAVYGESSIEVDADRVTCYLNIYDNTASYDYTEPYDDKLFTSKQMLLIDKLGCREFMTNPKSESLKTYTGAGPYELKFNNAAQYEAILAKVQTNSSDEMTVSLDYVSSEISDDKRKKIQSDMLDLALTEAKIKAERMAKSLSVQLGLPLSVDEMDTVNLYGFESEMYSGYSGMKVKVRAKVLVSYELKR